MTKRKYIAQVGMTVIHQVEFEADDSLDDDALDDLAGALAMKEVGGADDYQILELDYAGEGKKGSRYV